LFYSVKHWLWVRIFKRKVLVTIRFQHFYLFLLEPLDIRRILIQGEKKGTGLPCVEVNDMVLVPS